jgi:hypothetical protein
MNIDSRYSVGHSSSWPRAESVLRLPYPGSRAIAAPPGEDNDAQLFAQTRTLRIGQVYGFNLSTGDSTSPLRAVAILTLDDFHKLSRALGPQETGMQHTEEADLRAQKSRIAGHFEKGLRTGAEQEIVDDLLVLQH